MSDAEARMRRGREAGETLSALDAAFAAVRTELLNAFEATGVKDIAEREAVHAQLKALVKLRTKLAGYVAEGQLETHKARTE